MKHRKTSLSPKRFGFLLVAILALGSVASAQWAAEWKENVLYSFQGGTDGAVPAGGVVFDNAGNLYGATSEGGGSNCPPISYCGTVFQLAPPAQKGGPWTETVLHIFAGVPGNDGATPAGSLVIDQAGNLYGTTGYGGTGSCVLVGIKGGCGTVYELSPPQTKGDAWTYTILYSFEGGKDGYFPWGDLAFDTKGNLYGATQFGGGKGTTCNPLYQYCGTVFELSPPTQKGGKWTEKVLHSFAGIEAGKQIGDGANPNGGLAFDGKGVMYGTAAWGGFAGNYCAGSSGFVGCGTIFELKPPSRKGGPWSEKVLYPFKGRPNDGGGPNGDLIFDASGSLYGTTVGGGTAEEGVVFRLTAAGRSRWSETILLTFGDGNYGASPRGGLTSDSAGDLYGTNSLGGAVGGGEVYELKPPNKGKHTWTYVSGYFFKGAPDGSYPTGNVIFDKAGNLYGTTQQSGNTGQTCGSQGCGTVFEVGP